MAGSARLRRPPSRARRLELVGVRSRISDVLEADVVLLAHRGHAAGAARRRCPTASGSCPGATSTTSPRCRSDLVVVGSGVTGAEFASGYRELGVPVTLVSSRDRVLPGEDPDAAEVIEQVFTVAGHAPCCRGPRESVARERRRRRRSS